MKKDRLGLWSIILLGINGMIGTGIFLIPAQPMALVGPSSIALYVLVAAIAGSIALCFAECASYYTRNGAAYLYAKEAFGEFVGFEVGLMKWAVGVIAFGANVSGFVTIFGQLFPTFLLEPWRSGLICVVFGALGILNILGIQIFKSINNLISIGKLLPITLFIVCGIFYLEPAHYSPFIIEEATPTDFGKAALIIFFMFTGFETLAIAAEDIDNPRRNIPKALIIVLLTCSIIYILVQTVVVGILGSALAISKTPIADAALHLFGNFGMWGVMVCVMLSSAGVNIASSFFIPRIAVALADDGLLPAMMKKRGRFGTPATAIIMTVVAASCVALSGSFVKLAAISVVSRLCQYLPTCFAVLFLRKKYPAHFLKSSWVPFFAIFSTFWLLSNASMDEWMWGTSALLAGIPIYFYAQKPTRKICPQLDEKL